ncbi:MAG: peptidylprolyl isomerase [Akkermansiaceae bacterium]
MKHLLFIPFLLLAACQSEKASADETKPETPKEKAAAKNVSVIMKTSKGEVTIELNAEKAPITVKNFLTYVDANFYDGTIFHRVMDDFMIQGGGFTLKDDIPTEKKNNAPIKNEGQNGLSNSIGTIAMARTNDLNSATSQFFINVANNSGSLDHPSNGGYAVFGKVTAGMDVVNAIKGVNTTTKYMNSLNPNGKVTAAPHPNNPTTPIKIESIRRAK